MVTLLPCVECLVSLVDKPPFVAAVADVEHVHFERVTFTNKDFDLVLIFKQGTREKGEEEFVRISSIPRTALDTIKKWLDDVAELTYTEGVNNFSWKAIIEDVVRAPNFWLSEDDETGACPAPCRPPACLTRLLLHCPVPLRPPSLSRAGAFV